MHFIPLGYTISPTTMLLPKISRQVMIQILSPRLYCFGTFGHAVFTNFYRSETELHGLYKRFMEPTSVLHNMVLGTADMSMKNNAPMTSVICKPFTETGIGFFNIIMCAKEKRKESYNKLQICGSDVGDVNTPNRKKRTRRGGFSDMRTSIYKNNLLVGFSNKWT